MYNSVLNAMKTIEEAYAREFVSHNSFTLSYLDNTSRTTFALYLICAINKQCLPEWFLIKDAGISLFPLGFKSPEDAVRFIKSWTLGNKLDEKNYTVISNIPITEFFMEALAVPNKKPMLDIK